jgi:serine/threonine protein phosphatase PrpC
MKYFTQSGQELTLEKSDALPKTTSYQFEVDDSLGGSTLQGGRPYQEDRAINKELDDRYESLNEEERDKVLETCFATLNAKIAKLDESKQIEAKACGSTAVVAIVDAKKQNVKIANLGDSEAYLAGLNKDNKFSQQPTLLNSLHSSNNTKERNRITEQGGWCLYDRLGGALAVFRAFGDIKFEECGLSHTPEITTHSFAAINTPNDKDKITNWLIITASDGISERCKLELKESYLGKLNARAISKHLVNNARAKGSSDNITAQVAIVAAKKEASTDDVGQEKSNKNQKPTLLAVFDGHGGMAVSEFLRLNFSKHFDAALTNVYNEKQKQANKATTQALAESAISVGAKTVVHSDLAKSDTDAHNLAPRLQMLARQVQSLL